MQNSKDRFIKIIGCIACLMIASSCNKFLDVDPPDTSASAATTYSSNAQAAAVLTGIYGRLVDNSTDFADGRASITVFTGLTGDEFEAFPGSGATYMNAYTNSPDLEVQSAWSELYAQIYVCNAAIEGISGSAGITPDMKKQLLGEAKFMRGFMNFYLASLWGNVPLVMSTDYRINQSIPRSTASAIYNQVLTDLTEAKELLSNDYKMPNGTVATERVRPNKAAAAAMLARVYLYLGDWAKAEAEATGVISNNKFELVSLNDVFLRGSKEAVWQLASISAGSYTHDGSAFIRTVAPNPNEPVALSRNLVNAFVTGDQRKTSWVDSITVATVKYYYPKKYKVKIPPANTTATEFLMVLRLAEQYLIRAEARAKLNNLTGANSAQSDINEIRKRAGLGNTPATTQPDLLDAIEQERRMELFTEWGHRWLDLKRTNRLDAVMAVVSEQKGGTWSPNFHVFPIPRLELERNTNLQPQNPGYN